MFWIIEHLAIATGAMVVLGIASVVLIFLLLNRIYPHESRRPLFGSALVSILVTVLFPVIVNNWYAIKRDRDNRLRALRDQHFGQLRPVLHTESSRLHDLADVVSAQAHYAAVTKYEGVPGIELNNLMWPDLLSHDLEHHFSGYDKSKHDLQSEIQDQDREFRVLLSTVEQEIKPFKQRDEYWREVVAMSLIEFCTGRGEGIKITTLSSGYEFRAWNASNTVSGLPASPPKPSFEHTAALQAFQSLKPDGRLQSHCDSLKHRAEAIVHVAQELSREAQLESESAILKGDCDFLKSDSLSD